MSLTQRLADYLLARPGVWVDGLELSHVAGSYAWRTRLSELRRAPWHLQIENRVRVVLGPHNRYTASEYRLVPAARETQSA